MQYRHFPQHFLTHFTGLGGGAGIARLELRLADVSLYQLYSLVYCFLGYAVSLGLLYL